MPIFPKGLYTALITPFDKQGEIDFLGLELLIEEQIEAHVSGLLLMGITGEAPTLTAEEEKELITVAKNAIQGRVPLIVGVGSSSTAHSLQKLKVAKELGADGALVISPSYNRPSQEGLYYHFQALASGSALPLILYNHPARTGVNLELDTLRRLLPHPKIVGIKECSPGLSQFMSLLNSFKDELLVFSGEDPIAYSHLTLGAHGLFSVASHVVPLQMVRLVSLILERRIDEALNLHFELLPLLETLFIETNPAPVKKALELLGKPSGDPRLPLAPLSPHFVPTLQKLLCSAHPTSPL